MEFLAVSISFNILWAGWHLSCILMMEEWCTKTSFDAHIPIWACFPHPNRARCTIWSASVCGNRNFFEPNPALVRTLPIPNGLQIMKPHLAFQPNCVAALKTESIRTQFPRALQSLADSGILERLGNLLTPSNAKVGLALDWFGRREFWNPETSLLWIIARALVRKDGAA